VVSHVDTTKPPCLKALYTRALPLCLASALEESTLSAVQLLDNFATLALTTDQASESLLDPKPDKKTDPLFTVDMIKQIIRQSTYLIAVILIFHFLGSQILGFQHVDNTATKTPRYGRSDAGLQRVCVCPDLELL
jgi:magnesium-transporting ATPase (P-type)